MAKNASRFDLTPEEWEEIHEFGGQGRKRPSSDGAESPESKDADGIGVQYNPEDGELVVSPAGRREFVLHCVRLFVNGYYWFIPVGEKLRQIASGLNQEVTSLEEARRAGEALRLLRRKTPVLRCSTACGQNAVIHPPVSEWTEVLDILELLRSRETRALLKPPAPSNLFQIPENGK